MIYKHVISRLWPYKRISYLDISTRFSRHKNCGFFVAVPFEIDWYPRLFISPNCQLRTKRESYENQVYKDREIVVRLFTMLVLLLHWILPCTIYFHRVMQISWMTVENQFESMISSLSFSFESLTFARDLDDPQVLEFIRNLIPCDCFFLL